MAEETYRKKKQVLMVDQVKILARDLRNGKLQLRSIVSIDELEKRRQHQLRQLYLQEKSEKEQQHQIVKQQHQITNQDVAQMALARRKELERLRDEEQREEEKRLEELRAEQRKQEQRRAEQRRAEQRRVEQRKEEQRRAEQRRVEQQRAEQRRVEQQRAEQRRAEQRKEEQRRAEQHRAGQRREEQLKVEPKAEDIEDEQRRAEERREQQRREERRVEEQMAEQRRAQDRREDQRRAERRAEEQRAQQRREMRKAEERREELRWAEERRAELRRIEERKEELRRMEERREELRRIEERREELRREEEYRKELHRAEQLREEQRRAEEQRMLELEEANKAANLPKDQQQRVAAEELLRRVTGDTSTSIKFGRVKRQSVTVDEPPMKKQNNRTPANHWYNSTSSGVPLRNSTLVQSSEQWRRSASGSTQSRPKSMELLDFSTPQHTPHRREAPIGGYPSPPNHHAPSLPQSANPTRHQTRFSDKPPNLRANTMGHIPMTAVVHPAPPQTHHNQLENGFKDHSSNRNKVLNNYPSRPAPPPPPKREPYKTTYKNTEHGPTLYSMV